MTLFVKFANAEVPIYKLRKGEVVEYHGDFHHIKHVYRTIDQRVQLVLEGAFEDTEVSSRYVDWLQS